MDLNAQATAISDWDQLSALDITQNSSIFCLSHSVIFVSVSKLFTKRRLSKINTTGF